MQAILLALLALCSRGEDGFRVELPEGPAAKAWAGVGPATVPAPLPPELARLGADAWNDPATWSLWARLLGQERDAQRPDPARRAALALLARLQGRPADAWAHFAALSASPAHAALVLPHLLPGVPVGTELGPGGAPRGLEPGVVLRPLTPPPTARGEALVWSEMHARGFRIGPALVELALTLESSGVEVGARLLEGEETGFAVLLPEPEGFEIRIEYVDWIEAEEQRAPLPVRLLPGAEEPVTLWGRFLERPPGMPARSAGHVPAQMRLGGLWLHAEELDEAQAPLLEATASALGTLFGVEAHVARAGVEPPGPWSGTHVRLPARTRAQRLAQLASAVERHVLGGAPD